MKPLAHSEAVPHRATVDVFDKTRRFTRAREAMAAGLYPYFQAISSSTANTVHIDGHELVMAGSNNYLGYTHDPRVIEAAESAARTWGTGCTGSRFLNGTLSMHEELERELAEFCGKAAALVFSTGFQTNLGVISSLAGRGDVIFTDKLDHASIIDGCRLSYADVHRFDHNDVEALRRLLMKAPPEAGKLVVVDGVFSMEGDLSPLEEIVPLCQEFGARIVVDEAHAVGVLGETGVGASEELGVLDEVDLLIGTFSKAFSSIGGFVAGDDEVLHYVKHHARSLIFSASMPPYALATVLKCLELMREEPERRVRVRTHANYVNAQLRAMGFDTGRSITPVVPVVIGESDRTFMFWKRLFAEGVFTNPVVPPAVPEGGCLIRTSYMATHTEEHLDRVLSAFRTVGREFGMIDG